jgi:hypothetical protein
MNYSTTVSRAGLTGSDVMDIRYLHDTVGLNDAQLSRMYSVTRKAIYNIVTRKVWRQIPEATVVKGFTNYVVFPDGRVLSKATGTFITAMQRTTGPVVRIRNSKGARTTVPVATLLKSAKFA